MQIDGISAVGTSTGSTPAAWPNIDVNSPRTVSDSVTSKNNIGNAPESSNKEQGIAMPSTALEPLKSMSTSDFLILHNTSNDEGSVMNKMMKLLEAVLALKLLDETLEDICQSGFKFEMGLNKQEVVMIPKKQIKEGFFEKLFHFFT